MDIEKIKSKVKIEKKGEKFDISFTEIEDMRELHVAFREVKRELMKQKKQNIKEV